MNLTSAINTLHVQSFHCMLVHRARMQRREAQAFKLDADGSMPIRAVRYAPLMTFTRLINAIQGTSWLECLVPINDH